MRNWIFGVGLAFALAGAARAETAAPKGGAGNMVHCPTAVPGAKFEVANVKEGVEITVTGETPAAEKEIRSRAKHLVDAAKMDPESVRHTGDGHGGGGIGRCPVVLKDTVITSEDVKGGAKLTVKSVKPVDVDWLRKETAARAADSKSGAPKSTKK
ncbi:MAG TPA: hypothetical protein VFF06_36145 [Polyangia bacterium]|nr:hypothetical protein [Polyangia bacterium]